MNLKVQIPCTKLPARNNHTTTKNLVKKSNSLPFVESIKKSVLCPMMPWRCRGGEKEEEVSMSENRKCSEVGRQIFQAADVITKSPQKSKSFEDLTMINNNDSSAPTPSSDDVQLSPNNITKA